MSDYYEDIKMSWDFSITLSRTRCPCGLGWIKHGILINDWNQQKEGDELDCIYCDTRRMIEVDFGNDIQKKYSPDFLLWYREYMHKKIESLERKKRQCIFMEHQKNAGKLTNSSYTTEEDAKFLNSIEHDERDVQDKIDRLNVLKINKRQLIEDEMVRIASTDVRYEPEKMVRFEAMIFNACITREQLHDAYERLKNARKLDNVRKEDFKYISWHKSIFDGRRVLAVADRVWSVYLHFNNEYNLYLNALKTYNEMIDEAERSLRECRLKVARKKNSERYIMYKRTESGINSNIREEYNKAKDEISNMHCELFELVCGEYAGECRIITEN